MNRHYRQFEVGSAVVLQSARQQFPLPPWINTTGQHVAKICHSEGGIAVFAFWNNDSSDLSECSSPFTKTFRFFIIATI